MQINTLQEFKTVWKNTQESHELIHLKFCNDVNNDPVLKAHRDFVEQNIYGFGERSFYKMWQLIVKEMPSKFTFLEIGVFKGAILSLIKILASLEGKEVERYGITPLDNTGLGDWTGDYKLYIETMHDQFKTPKDYELFVGLSQDPVIIENSKKLELDILFIDGGHEYEDALMDLVNYTPLLKPGGILVMDDSANHMNIPFGMFGGIMPVTKALLDFMEKSGYQFEFVGNVVHNTIFIKK